MCCVSMGEYAPQSADVADYIGEIAAPLPSLCQSSCSSSFHHGLQGSALTRTRGDCEGTADRKALLATLRQQINFPNPSPSQSHASSPLGRVLGHPSGGSLIHNGLQDVRLQPCAMLSGSRFVILWPLGVASTAK